ncbi:6995_t:CDS:1 [Diversispora eburnea]|uniref:6995_t:CDS:1 n=1 Tax=Diversispora eburnea TaxID=1213867 RepID=A0A9N8V168_9GLOM|nr:6995_t:CDS:1 [Diversispora eburnea]
MREIFKDLSISTLFKCIQVDSYWCWNGVPLIWRNPFLESLDGKNYKIIPIILSYISKETREFLNLSYKIFNIPTSTFFNYPSFCRQIEIGNHIEIKLAEWIKYNDLILNRNILNNLIEIIFQVIWEKCEKIDSISISFCDYAKYHWAENIFSGIKSKDFLFRLNLLRYNYSNQSESGIIFKSLNSHVKHIKILDVYQPETSDKIQIWLDNFREFIKNLDILEIVILRGFNQYLPTVFGILVLHKKSIRSFEIYDFYADEEKFEFLLEFDKLENLLLEGNFGLNVLEPLSRANFNNLSQFSLIDNSIAWNGISLLDPISALIQNNGNNFTDLRLDNFYSPPGRLEIVAKYCPNLLFLSTRLYSILDLDGLFSVFKNCKKLEKLVIDQKYHRIFKFRLDEFVLEFSNNFPETIQCLEITDNSLELDSLITFLDKSGTGLKQFKYKYNLMKWIFDIPADQQDLLQRIENVTKDKVIKRRCEGTSHFWAEGLVHIEWF